MCIFVSRPMKIATFLRKKRRDPITGCWFSLGKRHIPKQNHGNRLGFRRKKLQQQRQTLEIVEDFACEAKFLHFSAFFSIFHFSSSFFHVSFFSFFLFSLFFIFPFFIFFHFHFLSISFNFFHFLCLCWVLKIWFFFGPQFRYDFSWQFLRKKNNF